MGIFGFNFGSEDFGGLYFKYKGYFWAFLWPHFHLPTTGKLETSLSRDIHSDLQKTDIIL